MPELIAIVSVRRGEVSTAPQPLEAFTVISRHSALLVGDPPRCCTRSLVFCAAHCADRSSSSPLFLDFPTLFVQAVRGAVVRAALSCNVSGDVALLVWHLWCPCSGLGPGARCHAEAEKKRYQQRFFLPAVCTGTFSFVPPQAVRQGSASQSFVHRDNTHRQGWLTRLQLLGQVKFCRDPTISLLGLRAPASFSSPQSYRQLVRVPFSSCERSCLVCRVDPQQLYTILVSDFGNGFCSGHR